MTEVSTLRLNLLRVLYLLMFVGLGSIMWPRLISHEPWEQMEGVAYALLGALSLLAGLGLRYPLQMLPILLFELLWKTIWLLLVALPLWSANQMDPDSMSTVFDCLLGIVICPIVIPWPYVWANFVRKRGERWRGVAQNEAPAVVVEE
jgi:hypothetical protein